MPRDDARRGARAAAWIAAVVLSLSAPGLALARGAAHDHLVRRRRRGHHAADAAAHGHPAPAAVARELAARDADEIEPAEHAHDHAHATVDVAPGTRDSGRLDLTVGYSVPAASLPMRALNMGVLPALNWLYGERAVASAGADDAEAALVDRRAAGPVPAITHRTTCVALGALDRRTDVRLGGGVGEMHEFRATQLSVSA